MLVRAKGRKSGKLLATPLRYIEEQDTICCSTSKDTQWWKNVRANPDIILRIRGREESYHGRVTTNDPDKLRGYLLRLIEAYPQDAVYHQIDLDPQGMPDKGQLEAALTSAVMVEAVRSEPAPAGAH